jgi:hypothetical protein
MTEIKTGTDALRSALRARKFNLAARAHDMGMRKDLLEAFLAGSTTLTPRQLATLTTELFGGHAVYDPAIDRLRPTRQQPPLPLGSGPPPLDASKLPTFTGGPPPPQTGYGFKPVPKAKRAGWVE